jgi:hypothetical protein
MKTYFMVYMDSSSIIDELTDEQSGQVFKALFHWNKHEELPQNLDFGLRMVCLPFVNQFKREMEAYERRVARNRENGKYGGRKSQISKESPEEEKPKIQEPNQTEINPLGSLGSEITQSEPLGCNTNTNTNTNRNKNKNTNTNTKSKIHIPKNAGILGELLPHFNLVFKKRCSIVPPKIAEKYTSAVKQGFTTDQIKLAMTNASKDEYHINSNYKHCTMEFFSRMEKIDKFANESVVEKPSNYNPTK